MFDQINGLPAHALIVHAAVVFTPLAALCAIVFAAMPKWRWALRWPLVALTVIAMGSVLVAVQSGMTFRDNLGITGDQIDTHQSRAKTLRLVMVPFTVLALVAAYFLGGSSPMRSGWGERTGSTAKAVHYGVAGLLVVAAVVSIVLVIMTGDAGTRTVYGSG